MRSRRGTERGVRSLCAALAAALLSLAGCGVPPPRTPRVVLLAVDGLEPRLLDAYARSGALPHLDRLRREGVSAPLRSLPGYTSPALWTTVATGRRPEVHGVPGWTVEGPDGRLRPATSDLRRVPALWEIAGRAGLRSTVVGWLATWPATPVDGYLVSSFSLFAGRRPAAERTERVLKGTLLPRLARQTHPPELLDEIRDAIVPPEAVGPEELAPLGLAGVEPVSPRERSLLASVRFALAADLTFTNVARRLFARERTQLQALYLGGVDAVSHRFWRFLDDPSLTGEWSATEDERARFGSVIPGYYRLVDGVAGELLAGADPATTIVVLSDHGFRANRRTGAEAELSGTHRHVGILIMYGRGIRPGAAVDKPSLLDIAPTVLALLGLPRAADMPGRPLVEALDGEPRRAAQRAPVPTYGTRQPPGRKAGPVPGEEALMEQLRSLGYVD